jgi:Helix-turn-helix domain
MGNYLVEREMVKEFYGVEEFARIVGKADFTVREWARLKRIRAQKRKSGRGAFTSWVISHDELLRYQREGLLQLDK